MNELSRAIAGVILFIGEQTRTFWDNLVLLNFSWQQITLDIILVSVIFYFIFSLIKGSRAVHVLIGLSIVLIIYVISKALQLVALSWLLDRIFTVVLVAIPIIFQKELLKASVDYHAAVQESLYTDLQTSFPGFDLAGYPFGLYPMGSGESSKKSEDTSDK